MDVNDTQETDRIRADRGGAAGEAAGAGRRSADAEAAGGRRSR